MKPNIGLICFVLVSGCVQSSPARIRAGSLLMMLDVLGLAVVCVSAVEPVSALPHVFGGFTALLALLFDLVEGRAWDT